MADSFDYVIALGEDFAGGALHLGLYGTWGSLNWTVSAPGNVASVPLPAGAGLMVAALAALGLAARRRRG